MQTTSGSAGTYLTDAKGDSLYLWVADTGSTSVCTGKCAGAWPPVVTTGAPKAGPGVDGSLLGTSKRDDGKLQVTYAGHPLYTFIGDKKPGDTAGQGSDGFNAKWWLVTAAGKAITG